MKILFHFTRWTNLSSILKDGIKPSCIPLNRYVSGTGTWLTAIADPLQQKWVCSSRKDECRVSLSLDAFDPSLWDWKDFALRAKISMCDFDKINMSRKEHADEGSVYLWTIPTTAITGIFCPVANRFLDKDEIEGVEHLSPVLPKIRPLAYHLTLNLEQTIERVHSRILVLVR